MEYPDETIIIIMSPLPATRDYMCQMIRLDMANVLSIVNIIISIKSILKHRRILKNNFIRKLRKKL